MPRRHRRGLSSADDGLLLHVASLKVLAPEGRAGLMEEYSGACDVVGRNGGVATASDRATEEPEVCIENSRTTRTAHALPEIGTERGEGLPIGSEGMARAGLPTPICRTRIEQAACPLP